MRTITVKVPRPLGERLGRAVVQRRSTRSAVVREAIEAYLAAEGGGARAPASISPPTSRGPCSGPSDLSSNRLRLRGYGR